MSRAPSLSIAQYRTLQAKGAKKHKYAAQAVEIDGHKFPSKAQAKRYAELRLLERTRRIRDLFLEVEFKIEVNGQHICSYIADFTYREPPKLDLVVEDVKGMRLPTYRLKKKLMKALHNIDIREIG